MNYDYTYVISINHFKAFSKTFVLQNDISQALKWQKEKTKRCFNCQPRSSNLSTTGIPAGMGKTQEQGCKERGDVGHVAPSWRDM